MFSNTNSYLNRLTYKQNNDIRLSSDEKQIYEKLSKENKDISHSNIYSLLQQMERLDIKGNEKISTYGESDYAYGNEFKFINKNKKFPNTIKCSNESELIEKNPMSCYDIRRNRNIRRIKKREFNDRSSKGPSTVLLEELVKAVNNNTLEEVNDIKDIKNTNKRPFNNNASEHHEKFTFSFI